MTPSFATPSLHPVVSALGFVLASLSARPALGQPAPEPPDRYGIQAQSTTYIRLFQRSVVAGGTQVRTDTLLPIYEYVTIRAMDIDTSWSPDSTDLELSAWGSGTFIAVDERRDADAERLADGDVTVANVRHRIGPGYVTLGRQIVPNATLRLSHIDGFSVGARAGSGLGFDAFGGLTVLPRWDLRPGYYHLGSAADSLLADPQPEPNRTEQLTLGSRIYYVHETLGAIGVAFHEQTENGDLGRRDLGLDASFTPVRALAFTADGFIDTDSGDLAEARARADLEASKKVLIAAEYRRAEPALLLSRQSVMSVFSTAKFDEVGGEVGARPTSRLDLGAGGWVEVFGGEDTGARLNLRARITPDRRRRVRLGLAWGRVVEMENGYWSWRASLACRFIGPAAVTFEHYTYLYDIAIRGIGTSIVESVSTEWAATRELKLLVATSVARTPYAALDVQTLARVSYGFDLSPGAPP